MGRQIFINQMQCNFNLRQPKANKPTNIYLVVYLNNKQVKLSTGVKVYPEHWNIRKQQAYVNARLSKLDNNNNTIANDRLSELKDMFLEFKHYLCEHPTDIDNSITILRTRIYKNTMTTEIKKKSATTVMKEIIDAKQAASSTKEQQKLNVGKFERYLKENNISDTWESMNLNTFEGYQKYLVDNGRGSVTIRNIIQNTLFPLLKKVSKRVDIPFTWYDSNLNSFEFVKDESNKELASNKKVTLTEEQLKQLYDYPITGTELQVRKRTEIRDLFVLQCLVGQRVGDMQKFFNGDNEKDEEEDIEEVDDNLINKDVRVSKSNPKYTKKQLKEIFKKYGNGQVGKNLENWADDFYKLQTKYGVDPLFAAAVTINEQSAGTANSTCSKQNNLFSVKARSGKWMSYSSPQESIDSFGNMIANGQNYFTQKKYTIKKIGKTYCVPPDNWIKKVALSTNQLESYSTE